LKTLTKVILGIASALLLTGCPWARGVVNTSPALRWWLFSNFGANKMCAEMLERGAPLKLTPTGNTIGRFFPAHCQYQVDDAQRTLTIDFSGTGFAWTPVAGRMGFSAEAVIEYRPDFHMMKEATYVWARTNRIVRGPQFAVGAVEYKVVDWATRTPLGYLANTFGEQIVAGQLANGFTVVRTSQGDAFTVGILNPPDRPKHPMQLEDDERYVFANETTEVHASQIDFLGPYLIPDNDRLLHFRTRLQGPALDVLVMTREAADAWREQLQRGAPLGPPPIPPLEMFVVEPGEGRRPIRLRKGRYVLVVDNSAAIGQMKPPWSPLSIVGANVALLSYSAELGEAD
jgi:hypothetical protein